MLTLISGGAACGKSAFAEDTAIRLPGPHYYIATLTTGSDENKRRIERHRALRAGKGFITVERAYGLDGIVLPLSGTALVESVGTLLANEMFSPFGAGEAAAAAVISGVLSLNAKCGDVVAVTDDVFCDGQTYAEGTQRFIELLGFVNRELAACADSVYEVVCGIPLCIKEGTHEKRL